MNSRVVCGVLAVASGLISMGCAQTVEDIDRTQPNKIRKSILDGEWYLSRVVIDVPYTTDFVAIGESAELERIRWEVQKDLLVAYRVYDRVEGTDKAITYTDSEYKGAPIVAYPITSHFDIVREYNPSTGEQSNVLVENTTDRPWYERDFIRVDWSKNTLPSLTFLINWAGFMDGSYWTVSPTGYHPEDPTDPHHMVVGTRGADGGWTDYREDKAISGLASADYIETTMRLFIEPASITFYDWWSDSFFTEPSCFWYYNQDCEHQNVVVRHSYMKVDPNHKYEALHYPDNEIARKADGTALRAFRDANGKVVEDPDGPMVRFDYFDKFGFFRIERFGYDPVYGELESNRVYYITRHNLLDDDGNPKPIVYYKSPDFPDWFNAAAADIEKQWSDVFKEAVTAMGKTAPEKMFEIRENTGQRIGDMRYSFLYYVPKPTQAGYLGYGPSLADPLSGEIMSAAAYVYGEPIRQYAANGQQIIDVINGYIDPEEIGLGSDVAQYAKTIAASKPGATARPHVTMDQLEDFVEQYVDSPRGKAIRQKGPTQLRRNSGWQQGQREKIVGTAFEHALINDEVKLMHGRGMIGPGDEVPAELMSHLSPVAWTSSAKRRTEQRRRVKLARKNIYTAEFVDDAIAGRALDLKDKGMKSAEVLRLLEIAVLQSTAEHEIGHTLGLRHNFAGSYDALNFPREFWDVQGADGVFPPKAKTPGYIAQKIDEYRYSSIMEYPARFNADIQGVGAYDRAAIMFGYAGMVEVFNNPPVDPMANFSDTFDLKYALNEVRHYTSLPTSLGGIDNMFDRRFVPYTDLKAQLMGETDWTLWEVPYRFCSDEYEGALSWCAMYDAGMDSYEIVTDAAERYRNYYFFNAFKRDIAGWTGEYYYGSVWFRYFRHMLSQYQHWVFGAWYDAGNWDFWRDEGVYGIEDVKWDLARDGGAPSTAASRAAISFLVEVLATPEPGGYYYDPDSDRYYRGEPDPSYWPLCGQEEQEKDNPDLPCVDLNIQLGQGRYSFTNYDFQSGYYFYERPKWVGSFEDKVLALELLSDSNVSFLGVNTAEDIQGYALGFFLMFPDILTKISGGIIADNINIWGGSTQFGAFYPPDPFNNELAPGRTIVDPDTWSTVQYYAIWYGMAGYASAFDNTFNDLMHVWYDEGDGSQSVPDVGDPSVATWYDPTTQRNWRAVKHPDDKLFSVGYEMVKRAAQLQSDVDNAATPSEAEYPKILLSYQKELLDLSQGMWEIYAKMLF